MSDSDPRPIQATPATTVAEVRWPVLTALSAQECRGIPSWLDSDPWAGELAAANPLLFFLLLRARTERRISLRQVRRLCRERRTRILGALGYDDSSSTERFLRRCRYVRLGPVEQLAVTSLIHQNLPDWARHWRNPHLALLTALKYPVWPYAVRAMNAVEQDVASMRELLSYGAMSLSDIERDIAVRRLLFLLQQIERFIYENIPKLDRRSEFMALSRCDSLAQLLSLHDRLLDVGREEGFLEALALAAGTSWPEAPIPGVSAIQPITSVEELIEEGSRMHHCISSYVSEIVQGAGYAYRVVGVERATLYIEKNNDGSWSVEDIRSFCNARVSPETRGVAEHWLHQTLGVSWRQS